MMHLHVYCIPVLLFGLVPISILYHYNNYFYRQPDWDPSGSNDSSTLSSSRGDAALNNTYTSTAISPSASRSKVQLGPASDISGRWERASGSERGNGKRR